MADINNSDATAPLRRVIGRHLVCHAPHAKLLLAACLLGSPNSNSNHAQQQQHVVPDITSAVTMRISVVAAGSGNPMIRSLAIDGETTVSALKVEIRALATTPPPADRDFRLCLGHGGTALQGGDGSLVAQGVRPGAVLVVIVDHLTQDQVLQRLYEDCNGRKWRKSAGWCGPAPSSLANWHGVTATRDGLHVVKLSLECNSLEGWFVVSHHHPLCCVSWRVCAGSLCDCNGVTKGRGPDDDLTSQMHSDNQLTGKHCTGTQVHKTQLIAIGKRESTTHSFVTEMRLQVPFRPKLGSWGG